MSTFHLDNATQHESEDRQDLLGHKSGRITTHYSAAELSNLLEAAEKACIGKEGPVLMTLLKGVEQSNEGSRKSRVIDLGLCVEGS